MAYILKEIILEGPAELTDAQYGELWSDIASGRLPLVHTSDGEIHADRIPVTLYDDCKNGKAQTISIRAVDPGYLNEMRSRAEGGEFRLFETTDAISPSVAAGKAWKKVEEEISSGRLIMAPGMHVEATLPATSEGPARAFLYIKPVPSL